MAVLGFAWTAVADCNVSPAPPAPQLCDPGGAGGKSGCDFTDFTSGSFASVGTGGTSSATSVARRTVFEFQQSSDISNCDVYNPENEQQKLFEAESRAVADATDFEGGVYVLDLVPGRGDPFSGTLEASNSTVAAGIDFGTLPDTADLDAVIHIDGGFIGSGGRATVQLAVRDFADRTLGAFFAASRPGGVSTIYWRTLDCPDPRSGCGSFVDRSAPFPGVLDLPLKIPATANNGIWIELKCEAPLDADAAAEAVTGVDFRNTASLELLPPPGVNVSLVTGQGFEPSTGVPFSVRAEIEGSEFSSEAFMGNGADVRTATAQTSNATGIGRGTGGAGRLLAVTDEPGEIFLTQTSVQFDWQDTITPSGAEVYRFELELSGDVNIGDAPGDIGTGKGSGDMLTAWRAVTFVDGQSTLVLGQYDARQPEAPCPMGTVDSSGGCFFLDSGESSQFAFEVMGSGDLADGPVVVAFDVPLSDGVPVDASFSFSIFQYMFSNSPVGPVQMSMDLGTGDNHVRFLGVTAFTGGMPDESFSIVSDNGFDYTQPGLPPMALPEPSGTVAGLVGLAALAAVRRRGPFDRDTLPRR